MRRFGIVAGLMAILPFAATGALADSPSCALGPGPGGTPDPHTFPVFFDAFIASPGSPLTCVVSTPVDAVPAGVLVAYSADYRGFIQPTSTVRLSTISNGKPDTVFLTTTDDPDFFYRTYFGGPGPVASIDSTITLDMLATDDPGNLAELDTIDFAELARTTYGDLQTSVDQLAGDRTSAVTHLNATADLLSGAGQPLEGENEVGGVGGVGSATIGVSGRYGLSDGFSLLGGMAFVDQTAGGTSTNGLVFSGSARYLPPGRDSVRPFGEVGLHAAPALSLSFSRDYATSNGTVSATGDASGSFFGGYIKGGVLFAPDPTNDVVFAATLGKDWLRTGAYTETLSGANPFAASAPAQTGSFDTVKIGADWTTRIIPQVDLTFSAAVGRTIAENAVATDVAFAGSFTGAPRSENFVEYGVRASHDIQPGTNLGAFVHGATGEFSGTHVQVGGDLHVSF